MIEIFILLTISTQKKNNKVNGNTEKLNKEDKAVRKTEFNKTELNQEETDNQNKGGESVQDTTHLL